jgi:hypothetical protein
LRSVDHGDITEDLNLQQHCCENFKFGKIVFLEKPKIVGSLLEKAIVPCGALFVHTAFF